MAQNKKVDVVTVGAGLVAGIMAYDLTKAGLEVVSLEQGPWLTTENDFTHDHDELRYNQRRELMVDLSRETWTWRPTPEGTRAADAAVRFLQSAPGCWRRGSALGNPELALLPLRLRISHRTTSNATARTSCPQGNRIRDWGVTYDEYGALLRQVGVRLWGVRHRPATSWVSRSKVAMSSKVHVPVNTRCRH